MGGEKQELFWALLCASGSPPHGRGKVVLHCGVLLDVGITPAWAGSSPYFLYGKRDYKDHPRTGGEKLGKISAPNIGQGSPPRGRGKVKSCGFLAMAVRITPA